MPNELTTPEFWDSLSRSGKPHPFRNGVLWARSELLWNVQLRRMLQKVGEIIDLGGKSHANIMEIGCAPGTMLEYLHRLRPQHHLHGVDYAEKDVIITERHLHSQGVDAEIHYADLLDFEPSIKYDIVLSFGLIEHFRDPVSILRHHARLAAPGGLVAVTVPNYAVPFVQDRIRRFDPDALNTHNVNIMNERILRESLHQAGLQQIQVGSVGGPQIRSRSSQSDIPGVSYRYLARLWNLSVALLPIGHLTWNSTIWGLGFR